MSTSGRKKQIIINGKRVTNHANKKFRMKQTNKQTNEQTLFRQRKGYENDDKLLEYRHP